MSNEKEGEDYVLLSNVRRGHKREFQFALKSQNELPGSMSRLRVRKRVTESHPVLKEKKKKVVVVVTSESDGDSDVVDLTSDVDEMDRREKNVMGFDKETDSDGGSGSGSDSDCVVVVEEDERLLKGVPCKFKDLLETGFLEGLNVRYIHRTIKSGKTDDCDEGLAGVIKGTGILCFCDECMGVEIVSTTLFELHAGSAKKRPADYIHLENGNTIRDVLNACQYAKLGNVAAAIRNAISSSPQHSSAFCRTCREPIFDANTDKMTMLCGSCSDRVVSQKTPKQFANTDESTDRSVQRVSLQRACNTAPKANSSSTKCEGKITRKDTRLHKLVFQDDVLADGTELGYYLQGKKLLSGYKKGPGIYCGCCSTVVSPSQFESHAGCASRRKPYLQIYTSNGVSLHELSVRLSIEKGLSTDENDDLCHACQGAGDLLCCDGCPRVFHLECVPLTSIPDEKWYCKVCDENFQMERFAAQNSNAIAAGRIPGVDPMEQITNRCIRIVKMLDTQDGGCALCRIQDFSSSTFGPRTVIICDQCEKEYHVGCMKEHDMEDLKELPIGDWFCSSDCERVNTMLKELLEQRDQKLPDYLLHVVNKKFTHEESNGDELDIKWRILHGRKSSFDETQPLLSTAVSVFHEQFDPILYGVYEQDLIPHMVNGRNLKETEFGGMYCAVLSVKSSIVSAGVFRVFSKEVAEIPLVATSKDCEGKGYFQCLYSCLENFLKGLGVKNLLLPAAEETTSMWMNRFGFNVINQDELNELKEIYPLMIFDGTSMLRKLISEVST